MDPALVQSFDEEMRSVFTRSGKATGYWPNYFLRKVKKAGGLKVAQDLLRPSTKLSTGFGKLATANRLDLSVEFLAIQPKWFPLFTDKERQIARTRLEKAGYIALPEEVPVTPGLIEGAAYTIQINAFERNPEARRRCIEHHGCTCCICGFNFGAVYGNVADGHIHIHSPPRRAAQHRGSQAALGRR
jgi:hypothetical protein